MMKKFAFISFVVIGFAFVSDPPVLQGDGKFVTGHKIGEGYYVSIRECPDSIRDRKDTTKMWSSKQLYLMFSDGRDDNPVFAYYHLDTIRRRAFREYVLEAEDPYMNNYYGNDMPELCFINRNLGFMYGTEMSYAFYPYVYRTEDGGKSWKLFTSKELGAQLPLNGQSFHMYNEKDGIIVWGSQPDKLLYSLTADGGLSWQANTRWIGKGARLDDITYTINGVTLTYSVNGGPEKTPEKTIVIRSTDYGKSFMELK